LFLVQAIQAGGLPFKVMRHRDYNAATEAALDEARATLDKIDGLVDYNATFPLMGSDNYSLFTSTFPGFYGFLGAANNARQLNREQHSPDFDVDESVLRKGAEFLACYALDFLG
jgi:metal-dependent amidase/aminoacylase/carboxypeptidase family protein